MVKNQSDSIQFNPFLFNPRLKCEWLEDQNYSVWINPCSNWFVENLPMNKINFCKVSEKNSIWTNPNHSEICLLIFRNDSEKRFEFCSMPIGFKSIWLNPIHSGSIWGFNPNECEQFRNLIPNYPKSFSKNTTNVLNFVWFKLVKLNLIQYNPIHSFSIRGFNPNAFDIRIIRFESIQVRIESDSYVELNCWESFNE